MKMIPRIDPVFVQFKAGDAVSGVLVRMEKSNVGGKPAIKYTVNGGGTLYCFLGTYQINSRIYPSDLNHWIEVKYVGEDTGVSRNGNAMRIFEVSVSQDAVNAGEFHAADSDIPF